MLYQLSYTRRFVRIPCSRSPLLRSRSQLA
jgi:hypothetical protein